MRHVSLCHGGTKPRLRGARWSCGPSSMLICVIGLPAPGYIGLALMSMVDLEAAADVWSALGAATFTDVVVAPASSSFLMEADLLGASLDADRWGMFRISLYLVCL